MKAKKYDVPDEIGSQKTLNKLWSSSLWHLFRDVEHAQDDRLVVKTQHLTSRKPKKKEQPIIMRRNLPTGGCLTPPRTCCNLFHAR